MAPISQLILATALPLAAAFTAAPRLQRSSRELLRLSAAENVETGDSRRGALERAALAGVGAALVRPEASEAGDAFWRRVDVGTTETLYDISFDPSDPKHGMLVGAKGSFFESFDGGKSWQPRSFSALDPDEEITYRYVFPRLGGAADFWVQIERCEEMKELSNQIRRQLRTSVAQWRRGLHHRKAGHSAAHQGLRQELGAGEIIPWAGRGSQRRKAA
eukprot:scaffold1226_cov250-Pinguiococcus_pyrenoidosus.AAC.10